MWWIRTRTQTLCFQNPLSERQGTMGQDSMMVESEAQFAKVLPLHEAAHISRYMLNNVAVPPMGRWPNPVQMDLGITWWWMTDFAAEIFPGAFVSWLSTCKEHGTRFLSSLFLFFAEIYLHWSFAVKNPSGGLLGGQGRHSYYIMTHWAEMNLRQLRQFISIFFFR